MKLFFRVDASSLIGSGHFMRCLALADEATSRGWKSIFVMRDPNTSIMDRLKFSGHELQLLTDNALITKPQLDAHYHSHWLSVSQETDAIETVKLIEKVDPDWVIVDHYALDAKWLSIVKGSNVKILVIDDLGDRELICDLLLDQNLGATAEKYVGKLPVNCRLLLGPTFALLRSEFREWRQRSLEGRMDRNVENILITMGGGDAENYTLRTLNEVTKSKYAKKCIFTVVVGGSYPHTDTLNEFVNESKLNVSVLSNVKNMAEIMSKSDLCIGAAGSTSWERCCMGQPTITFSIADNQIEIAEQLSIRNVAIYSNIGNLLRNFEQFFDVSGKELQRALSTNSRQICDGLGTFMVVEELEKKFEN